MFDFLLIEKLANKITDLARYREERDRRRFDVAGRKSTRRRKSFTLVEMFEAALADIALRKHPRLTAELVATARRKREATRSTFYQLLNVLRTDDKFLRYSPFLDGVAVWFDIEDNTPSLWLLSRLEGPVFEEDDWARLDRSVQYSLSWQRTKWHDVGLRYANAVVAAVP